MQRVDFSSGSSGRPHPINNCDFLRGQSSGLPLDLSSTSEQVEDGGVLGESYTHLMMTQSSGNSFPSAQDHSDMFYQTHLQPQAYQPISMRNMYKASGRKRSYRERDLVVKRMVANTQERCRMRRLNEALDDLRRCIPPHFHLYHRRLSKIKTLRLAISYISALAEVLNAAGGGGGAPSADAGVDPLSLDAGFGSALVDASHGQMVDYHPETEQVYPDEYPHQTAYSQSATPSLHTSPYLSSVATLLTSPIKMNAVSSSSSSQVNPHPPEQIQQQQQHSWTYGTPTPAAPETHYPRSAYETPVTSRLEAAPCTRPCNRLLAELTSPTCAPLTLRCQPLQATLHPRGEVCRDDDTDSSSESEDNMLL